MRTLFAFGLTLAALALSQTARADPCRAAPYAPPPAPYAPPPAPYAPPSFDHAPPPAPYAPPSFVRASDYPPNGPPTLERRRPVLSIINDTDDNMVIHIGHENVGWLKPRETRDFPLGRGKTVVSARSHDGDVYVHTYDDPAGAVLWYINEGH